MILDLFNLSGKTAVVIGGAGGIGQAIAKGLCASGAKVMIASRSEESLKKAVQDIGSNGLCYHTVDASDEQSVQDLFNAAVKQLGEIYILVNSQGFNKKYPAVEFPIDIWDEMFAINVRSIMLSCKYFGDHMKKKGRGKIINISSVRGLRACGGGNTGYCATKGAVDMLTRTLAVELGPEVCVNAIGPTVTATAMMAGFDADKLAALGAGKPLKRIGNPEDCIGPAIFLASQASDFITGQIIYPDGGLTAIG
jgi:gluconate 5-dehydrogenase